MKDKFEKPRLEIIKFDTDDVIQTSGCHGFCKDVCAPDCIIIGDHHRDHHKPYY